MPTLTTSTAQSAPAPFLDRIENCATEVACRQEQFQPVSEIPQHQVEAELDAAILELGAASVQAMQNEDPQGAAIYSRRMYAAIASRTPEHQARLQAEVEQRISDGLDYFQTAGARDRMGMERRRLA